MHMKTLLIADDHEQILDVLKEYAQRDGYRVQTAKTGREALELSASCRFDAILLDVMMPEMDGFEVCRQIRRTSMVPVIMITARGEDFERIMGLDIGADDYMVKPFAFQELSARVRAMTRKKAGVRENIYRCGELSVDCNEHVVRRGGDIISLSPKEFSVLLYLIRNQNIVVSREQIEANIWDMDHDSYSNVIDVYIRYLRKKIDDPYEVKMIQTVRGVGYVLRPGE